MTTEIIITNDGKHDHASIFVDGHNHAHITGERIVMAISTKTKQTEGVFAYMGNVIVGQFHNLHNAMIRDNRGV